MRIKPALAATALLLSACTSSGSTGHAPASHVLHYPSSTTPAGMGVYPVGTKPQIVLVGELCTDGPAARITSVHPVHLTRGFHLLVWGLTPPSGRPIAGGPGRITLSQGSGYSHAPITDQCSKDKYAQLSVNISRSAPQAHAKGIVVEYTAAGRSGSLTIPFDIDLCARRCHGSSV